MDGRVSRRKFVAAASAAGAAIGSAQAALTAAKPALLGGVPVRTAPFPGWPVWDRREEQALLQVLGSGNWFRGNGQSVKRFEEAYARLTGASYCLATSSGTGALLTALGALGVGPGDEVILPPFTFVATLNVILMVHALPVFVDSDLDTWQIDARKIEAAVTPRTAAMIPVHLGGSAADLDTILAVAAKHKLPVIEDACQSHLAEWRGRKVGALGTAGCFSFQASKNLPCGEGGALVTSDEELFEKSFAYHWNGSGRKRGRYDFTDAIHGAKFLITEFQAALLTAQMSRLEEHARTRDENARYLTSLLKEIPGIHPARMYDGCTRNAYHIYMFRYEQAKFAGLTRARFLQALGAEGIPASAGYTPLNRRAYLANVLHSRGYRRIYSQQEIARIEERNQCPANDRLCAESVWIYQSVLLARRGDMDQIAEAIRKIQSHAPELART